MKTEFYIFTGYFLLVLLFAFFSSKKQKSHEDFILGNRSLNFWLTALSAQASDMSSWLFLAYPALIFGNGVFASWAAVGLVLGMVVNWHYIAPKLRTASEKLGSLTLSSYFEARFKDTSGSIGIVSGLMSVLFFMFYISSGLVAMGLLVETLFGVSYYLGIFVGLFVVVLYVLMGGYRTVAWIDLFQGFFLLGVIVFIPAYLLIQIKGITPILDAARMQHLTSSLLPDFKLMTFWKIFIIAAGWGLGYFGQPHILTKFMGIRCVSEMRKSKYVGLTWLVAALTAATFIGLIGIYIFPKGLSDPQLVILKIVQANLSPMFAGLVLCAVLAATTNVMAAHILVVASNLSEDLYKKIFDRNASQKKLLTISRISVVAVAGASLVIAFFKISTIYTLVLYSWSGLGASFGPLLLLSLYRRNLTRQGAFAGILTGGAISGIWPYVEKLTGWEVSPIVPAFACSLVAIELISYVTRKKLLPKTV